MKIWSDSLHDGGSIRADNAFAALCLDGHVRLAPNRNPHLAWDEVPAGTESLALLCIDGDAPRDASDVNREGRVLEYLLPRGDFFHWSVIDIPVERQSIAESEFSDGVTPRGKSGTATSGLRQGVNDYSKWFAGDPDMAGDYYGYDGPCPPWNDLRLHHYIFRIYALDVWQLALPGRFTGADVCAAIYGHIIDEAQLIATYTLNSALAAQARRA